MTLILDLTKQPGILNSQDGLCGEGLKQTDHFRRKTPRGTAENGQTTHDPLLTKQRNRQQGPVAELSQYGPHASGAIFLFIENVRYFHGRSGKCCLSQRAAAESYGSCTRGIDKFFPDFIAAPKMKLFRFSIIFVDNSSGCASQLDGVGGNAGKHGFEIYSRADGFT